LSINELNLTYLFNYYFIFAVMRKLLLVLLIVFVSFSAKSQYDMDFGINLGGANYIGEIGGTTGEAKPWLLDMKLSQTNFAVGGFYRYSFTKNIAAKFSFNYARISGADSLSDEPTRIGRNLSFRTDIIEASLTGEYSFFTMNDMSRRSRKRVDFRAYGFAGAGVCFYYPYAQLNDKWFYLRPLQTEGTENAYDEMTIAVPTGLGAAFTFNKKIRIGVEIGYRFTFTDYLDDVSTDFAYDGADPEDIASGNAALSPELPFLESHIFANRSNEAFARGDADLIGRKYYERGSIRGNPDANDGYLLAQFSISYVISSGNNFSKARYNSIINRRRKRTKF
jgi:hypothetical protein